MSRLDSGSQGKDYICIHWFGRRNQHYRFYFYLDKSCSVIVDLLYKNGHNMWDMQY